MRIVTSRGLPQHVMGVKVTGDESEGREAVGLDEGLSPFVGFRVAVNVEK